MSEPQHESFRRALLAQEPHIPENEYQEYRMKLEQAYQKAFRWERRALLACLTLLGLSLASMALLAVLAMRWRVVLVGWPLAIPNALFLTGVTSGYLWYRFKLRLGRCDEDRKVGQIAEISHKLDELTRRFDIHFGGDSAKRS